MAESRVGKKVEKKIKTRKLERISTCDTATTRAFGLSVTTTLSSNKKALSLSAKAFTERGRERSPNHKIRTCTPIIRYVLFIRRWKINSTPNRQILIARTLTIDDNDDRFGRRRQLYKIIIFFILLLYLYIMFS